MFLKGLFKQVFKVFDIFENKVFSFANRMLEKPFENIFYL